MTHLLPQIAIIGRANVGKSTLFNRLIEQNKALVSKIAGTTRDRNIATAEWRGRRFQVIDTGGLDINKKNPDQISQEIIKQSQRAINKANLILFVVDAKSGIIASDSELAKALVKNKQKDKTILVVNKADSLRWRQPSAEMYKLNLGQPNMLSAANGSGVGDLLDLIVSRLPADKKIKTEQPNNEIKVAIVGKPNVGKSSLLNSILGEERVMVTDIAHTTRESHDTEFIYKKNKFTLIDTAGISRDNKLKNKSLEKKSIDRSLETIAKADIVLLVTEVQKNISTQDKKITQAILENSKSVIIVANKWDLIPDKDEKTINRYIDYYQANFPYLWWAPIIFVSAKENLRTKKILDLILDIQAARSIQLTDKQLERFLKSKIKQHRPARGRGLKNPYIYKLEQAAINPPRIIIYVNDPKILHFSYIRFLQNNLHQQFNIIGTPIQIEVKKWKSK